MSDDPDPKAMIAKSAFLVVLRKLTPALAGAVGLYLLTAAPAVYHAVCYAGR